MATLMIGINLRVVDQAPGPGGLQPGDECFLVLLNSCYGEGVFQARYMERYRPSGLQFEIKAQLGEKADEVQKSFFAERCLFESPVVFRFFADAKEHYDLQKGWQSFSA